MRHDCIIVGGGHNGLVCAAYLARAGFKVLVLESAACIGGAAVTREFSPGFRVSAGAHLLHLLPNRIVDDLGLRQHGFELAGSNLPTTAVGADQPLHLSAGSRATLSGASAGDAQAFGEYTARMQRFARVLRSVLEQEPPRLGSGAAADSFGLLRMGWRLRRLGRRDLRELLRIGAMNVYDLLQEHFESRVLQGALAFDAVLGSNLGPRSPGSVLTLLYRLAAESGSAGMCQPRGGLGAVSEALAGSARAAGAQIRTDAPVRRLLVTRDRVAGVVLDSGESIEGRMVASNADPRTTLLGLLGAEHLDAGFVRRVSHLRMRGLAAKLHVALDDLPQFPGVPGSALGGRLLVAPSMDYLERAFNHSKYDEVSAEPALEITIPTVADPTLAPRGRHVVSAIVQYTPHSPRVGWEQARQPLIDATLATIERLAPGFRARVSAVELLTPRDIEQQFRMHGGHWHHGELSFDQFFMVRPLPGAAQYAMPMPGLYLCGAGAHPGGGVMGLAGHNCARRILAEARAG